MFKKLFPVFLILFVFSNVFSQKAVYQLPEIAPAAISNPTFFYTLPKTAFQVDVVITKTSHIKGIYADFAEKMLGITNYCKENKSSFQLRNMVINPFSVPDETLQFVVELSSAQMKNNFLQSLYAKKATPDAQLFSTLEQNNADVLPDFFKNFADVMLQQSYETYTDTKIIDGVVTQVPVTLTKVTAKTLAQQAQEAVNFIEKIREDRYAILSFSQETALSKEAFEYLVNQLNELEKQYLELFTGITVLEDIHETIIVYPNKENFYTPVFSLTPVEGFNVSMHTNNEYNYYLSFIPDNLTTLQDNFTANLVSKSKTGNLNGFRIRKAVPVYVTLYRAASKETLLGIFPAYQFGLLETLPANLDSFEIEKWGYLY